MPLFVVTMKQVIEYRYHVEAFDEEEAKVIAFEEDDKTGDSKWYNDGHDGEFLQQSMR